MIPILGFTNGELSIGHLDVVVFVGYLIALLLIGAIASYRVRESDDLFLGGRSMGWSTVGFSIFGTNIGPNFLIATCGAGYTTGMVSANYEWMAWVFLFLLSMVFLPFYMATKISTMPEFLHRRFGPRCYTFMACYALFGTVVLWIGGTLYAGGSLMAQLLGWDEMFSIWVLAVLATIFTVAGGLATVMITDSFQSVLMIAGSATMTIIAFTHLDNAQQLRDVQVAATSSELTWKLFHPSGADTPWYAFVLGYPVLSLWFWCSDQTIVQRALGAKNLAHAQAGALFCGFLKILPPLIFLMPGILAAALLPGIEDDKRVYLQMVNAFLGPGLKGLILAVLVAAVVSTLNSGLNSFSTVYTLDIHRRWFAHDSTPGQLKFVGRVTTVLAGLMAVGIAGYLKRAQETGGMNLFDLFQSIIGYMAPPVSAVFLLGILWKRATSTAAFVTLTLGSVLCLGLGICSFNDAEFLQDLDGNSRLPHFLLQSFLLFATLLVLMVVISLLTKNAESEVELPSLRGVHAENSGIGRVGLLAWALLAAIMMGSYVFFHSI